MDKKIKKRAIDALRSDSYKTGIYKKVYKRSYRSSEGRAHIHECEICKSSFKRKDMQVDHILSVIPLHSSEQDCDMNDYIIRLYCDESGLQHICKPCHNDKTQFENHLRLWYSNGTIKKEILDEKLLEYLKDVKK